MFDNFEQSNPPWIWHSNWEIPGESMFSCLLKFSWINTYSVQELLKKCFGSTIRQGSNSDFHPRSLITTSWMNVYSPRNCPSWMRSLIEDKNTYSEHVLKNLCTDKTTRYCYDCLSNGVHFPEFQVVALNHCPIHKIPLESACRTCGSPTGRYAICEETFVSPFSCNHCGASYIGDLSPKDLNVNQFKKNANIQLLEPFHDWVKGISKIELDFRISSECLLMVLEDSPEIDTKRVFCGAAYDIFSTNKKEDFELQRTDLWHVSAAECLIERPGKWLLPMPDLDFKNRISIYKSIKRYLLKTYLQKHGSCWRHAQCGLFFESYGFNSLPKPDICIWAQAWIHWRSGFEEVSSASDLWGQKIQFNQKSWIYKSVITETNISNNECAVTILSNFHASFRILRQWMLSRWKIFQQKKLSISSQEFALLPPPYLQLMVTTQQHMEVCHRAPSYSSKKTIKHLIYPNETGFLNHYKDVCNPYFPKN